MITDEHFEELLALGYERPSVEFKGPGLLTDKHFCARVVKAALGMANRRDGGLVVIGVSDSNGVLNPVGLSNAEIASWRYDDISAAIAAYADPSVSFGLATPKMNGKKFVVLQIHEFDDIPVLCKKKYEYKKQDGSYDQVLREGALYVRTRRKPETTEIPSQTEMRDLLELATAKRLQKFIALARSAPDLSYVIQPRDEEQFKQQFENSKSKLPETILSRGYWQVIIKPIRFYPEKIDYTDLYPLLEKTAVSHSGYDFPQLDWGQKLNRDVEYICQNLDWAPFPEAWYFYQSGQFIDISAIDNAQMAKQEQKILSVQDILYRWTEIFEFASRLVQNSKYVTDKTISIEVLITRLEDRQLYLDFSRHSWMSSRAYKSDFEEFSHSQEVLRDELIANFKGLALQAAKKLFDRLGWEPRMQLLQDIQAKLS